MDDLGCLVRVEATPVRADGKAGQTVCSEAFTVGLTQQFRSIVGELLEHGYSVLPVCSASFFSPNPWLLWENVILLLRGGDVCGFHSFSRCIDLL